MVGQVQTVQATYLYAGQYGRTGTEGTGYLALCWTIWKDRYGGYRLPSSVLASTVGQVRTVQATYLYAGQYGRTGTEGTGYLAPYWTV
jgi:hypothetical protein